MERTNNVPQILADSMCYNQEYSEKTLKSRLKNSSIGSFFDCNSLVEVYGLLLNGDWEFYEHPAVVGEDVFALRANIPGTMGIVSLDQIDDHVWLCLDDPKETGDLSCHLYSSGECPNLGRVDFTVMIVGPIGPRKTDSGIIPIKLVDDEWTIDEERYDLVMYTVHPGDPIRPGSFKASDIGKDAGDLVTVKEAKDLGFQFAKIED